MKKFVSFFAVLIFFAVALSGVSYAENAYAMPFYGLQPKPLVVRAEFFTGFSNSSEQRKANILRATKSLDNTFVDVGAEFSFNKRVGKRTEKNGYKPAKIIANGNFVEGVGGGVCQVSTTLYNALLLADLKIIEYHPHSLAVSYVDNSFDAMVSDSYADLRFINNTKNPVIIKAFADQNIVKITIIGEKNNCKITRQSEIIREIPYKERQEVDTDNLYMLSENQRFIKTFGKNGVQSKGYLIKEYKNGKRKKVCIRTDYYKPIDQITVIGAINGDNGKS